MCLFLLGGCSLRGAPWIESIRTRCSTDYSLASDSFSFLFILLKSLFILLIFFLLNLVLALSDALVILSFKESIWHFKLSVSASSLLNSLFSLESLFLRRLSCLFIKGASNLGLSLLFIGSQVDICGSPEGAPLHGGVGGLFGQGGRLDALEKPHSVVWFLGAILGSQL